MDIDDRLPLDHPYPSTPSSYWPMAIPFLSLIALPSAEGTIGPRETWLLGFSKMAAAMASKDSNGDGFILVEDASAVIDSYDLVRTCANLRVSMRKGEEGGAQHKVRSRGNEHQTADRTSVDANEAPAPFENKVHTG